MPMAPLTPPVLSSAQTQWVHRLEAAFAHIARTRMAGLPVLNPRVRVQAVGFHARTVQPAPGGAVPGEPETGMLGVLVTPWFMNLVWRADNADGATTRSVGHARTRVLNGEALAFLGTFESAIGAFEACSLISPMFQFADHAAAVATAAAALDALREPPAVSMPADDEATRVAARRGFLFGRGGRAVPSDTGGAR